MNKPGFIGAIMLLLALTLASTTTVAAPIKQVGKDLPEVQNATTSGYVIADDSEPFDYASLTNYTEQEIANLKKWREEHEQGFLTLFIKKVIYMLTVAGIVLMLYVFFHCCRLIKEMSNLNFLNRYFERLRRSALRYFSDPSFLMTVYFRKHAIEDEEEDTDNLAVDTRLDSIV
ncbi:unnamed protein product [Caenorhabditis brenneri]